MRGGYNLAEVTLECRRCGHRAVIWRKRSRLKEPGHVKHLWCAKCEDRTPHVEMRGEK